MRLGFYSKMHNDRSCEGFTLLELLLVLAVLSVILVPLVGIQSTFHQQEHYAQNQHKLEDIRQAMQTFLKIEGFLPCPDTDGDGRENRQAGGQCKHHTGQLPYLLLQTHAEDAYGQPFMYVANTKSKRSEFRQACRSASVFSRAGHVTNEYYECGTSKARFCKPGQCNDACNDPCYSKTVEKTLPPYFNQFTPPRGATTALNGALRVCTDQAAKCAGSTALSRVAGNSVPVVVLSFGHRGRSIWKACEQASARGQENCDGDRYFIQFAPSKTMSQQVIWLSVQEIKTLRDYYW